MTASSASNAVVNSVEGEGCGGVKADMHSCNTVANTSLIHTKELEGEGVELLRWLASS